MINLCDGCRSRRGAYGCAILSAARHKLSESFIAAFYENFVAHGAEAIETMRLRNPGEYVRAVVAILPKQTEEIANPFDGITSDELDELLAAVRGLKESEGEADTKLRILGGPVK